VWKDGGRRAGSRGRSGPQYVHVDVFRSVSGGRVEAEVGGERSMSGMSSEDVEDGGRGVVGVEVIVEEEERYGMNAWEEYWGSGSMPASDVVSVPMSSNATRRNLVSGLEAS
jgi:hypothetical protein